MNNANYTMDQTVFEKVQASKHKLMGEVLNKNAQLMPERLALEFGEKVWTFKELNDEVNRFANGLTSIGVQRGDRVAVLTQNRAECCHILYGAGKIGAISAFLNWRYSIKELVEALDVITPETIIVSKEYKERMDEVLHHVPYIKRVICLDDITNWKREVETFSFQKLIHENDNKEPIVALNEEDILFIVYTSGTTGTPKGASVSHRAEFQRAIAQKATFSLLLQVNGDDAYIARDPFFHMASIDLMFGTHAMGGKVIILAGFNPDELVDKLEENKVSWLCLAPGMYDRLIKELKSRKQPIKGLKAIGSMADMVSRDTIREITKITNAPFLNTYGMTEIGMHNLTQNVIPVGLEGYESEHFGKSEGMFCEIRLVDSDGRDVPSGEPGELMIKTPMMFSGYWNNDAENKKVFRNGWFHTGDVLKRNVDGTLDFVSRTKYMIKGGGENIYPAEIERVLMSHPMIEEAVVIGTKHEKWGETPVAFIAVKQSLELEELKSFCKNNSLASYKLPSKYVFVDKEDFPRNTNGKILREQLVTWLD